MKHCLIVLVALSSAVAIHAAALRNPKPRWTASADISPEGISAAVDAEGNSSVAGNGVEVAHFSRTGRLLWSTNLHNGVDARDIWADRNGNVLVVGSQFDYASSPTNFADIWTFKFSPRGRLLWQQRFDSDDHVADVANRVRTDQAGNVYVVGRSFNSFVPGAYSAVLKYDPSGTLLWARRYTGLTNGTGNTSTMALDKDGNVAAISDHGVVSYAANGDFRWLWEGQTFQAGDFDPQGNLFVGFPLNKVSPAGTVLWSMVYTNPTHGPSYPLDIRADGHGNAFVGLDSPVHCILDDGDWHCQKTPAILKYGPEGNLLWASRFSLPTNTSAEVRGLAVGTDGNSFLAVRLVSPDLGTGFGLTARCNPEGYQVWQATYRPTDTERNYFFQEPSVAPNHGVIVFSEFPSSKALLLNYDTKKPFMSPRITIPPAAQTVALGSAVSFQVTAKGPGQLRYQWHFNSAMIPGATQATLNLPAASSQAGDYAVTVGNSVGQITSPVARLTVE